MLLSQKAMSYHPLRKTELIIKKNIALISIFMSFVLILTNIITVEKFDTGF
ncbi:hypothetical protein SAMN05444355_10473 [Flavobacterium frigoris]|uniref:Uncharacterized protein n=1 Tax=Flavobacterium frigoris TaxID=229204 RepID=A0A1H9IPD3_FLAFI|nr:hypothetical protein SAMN05444355_10473 [Flavobacterium frigoris]